MQALAAAREALASSSVTSAPCLHRPDNVATEVMHGPSLPPPGSAWTGPSWQPKPVSWASAPAVRGSQSSLVTASAPARSLQQNIVQSSSSHQNSHHSSSSSQRETHSHSSKHRHRDSKSHSDRGDREPSCENISDRRGHHSGHRSESESKVKREHGEAGTVKDGHKHRHRRDDRDDRSHHKH